MTRVVLETKGLTVVKGHQVTRARRVGLEFPVLMERKEVWAIMDNKASLGRKESGDLMA